MALTSFHDWTILALNTGVPEKVRRTHVDSKPPSSRENGSVHFEVSTIELTLPAPSGPRLDRRSGNGADARE